MSKAYDLGEVKKIRETDKAVLLTGGIFGSRKEWVPKSQTLGFSYKSYRITEWLAEKMNLPTSAKCDEVCQPNVQPSRFVRLMKLAKTKGSDTA